MFLAGQSVSSNETKDLRNTLDLLTMNHEAYRKKIRKTPKLKVALLNIWMF